MARGRWIAFVVAALILLFAVVVGGFFWPRPQFRTGPWTGESAPVDSISLPGHSAPQP